MHASTTHTVRTPGPLGRLAAILVLFVLLALGVVIAIPLILVGAALGLALILTLKIRNALARTRDPGGVLDERRNVRVIDRSDQS